MSTSLHKHGVETLAQAEEEVVLSRLYSNSDALPQGATIQLMKYTDHCYKNNETQLSTLSFDGWSHDPVLYKGQSGRLRQTVTLHCSAVVNVATIRKSTTNKALNRPPKIFAKSTPQDVVSVDRYSDHNVEQPRFL